MPELPEVETVMRGLEPAFLSQSVRRVTVNRADLRVPITPGFAEALSGQKITALIRRGKYIIATFGKGQNFVLHLGMSGRIHIHEDGASYHAQKHDHVVFEMQGGAKVIFNDPRRFGMLYLVGKAGWAAEKPFSLMGPEPLGNDFSAPILQERLHGRRGPIKTALLDQVIVAGLGNIYVCEALYESGISPLRPAGSLSEEEAARLIQAIRDVLNRALAAGGSTLKDYRHTDGNLGYFQHEFAVYDRAGGYCRTCAPAANKAEEKDGCIKRIVQSGRSTFYCPVTQK